MLLPRNITQDVTDALGDTPVVMIVGARQTGKSTFVEMLLKKSHPAKYFTMDDPTILAAASASPLTFLESLPDRVILDEVQRIPEIFVVLKKIVDQNRVPGRFVLTGSANVLILPKVSESLTGRMEIHTLWPLSQGEIQRRKEKFIDVLFSKKLPGSVQSIKRIDLIHRMVAGGYPEVIGRKLKKRRDTWFKSCITSILQRDVRDLANIEGLKELPHLLALLASRTGGLLNHSELSRISGIPQSTLKRYFILLEMVYLIVPLPAWFSNLGKRLVKSPKVYLNDTGLLCCLNGIDSKKIQQDLNVIGPILENFVVMELMKQNSWSQQQVKLYHFRTSNGEEVDIVLETPDGKLVGIEVKSASAVGADSFKGLKALQALVGDKFHRGVVLYTGSDIASFGKNLHAVPISALWEF
ncbi:MAG: ATPase [Nitrospinae bacterium CG11_big_fil_rev_8_21_14_0_20_45_15]|nr:MAG: ATPase [Nitrospinae bacterium CG11_big_fil_rev_8_21_14_0_20_45_15]